MVDKDNKHKKGENRCKEFVLYFRELYTLGISYGMNDLRKKAEEL